MLKSALITGITGQDGSYLAELSLSKGYEVYGLRRRASSSNTSRIDHLINDFRHEKDVRLLLQYADLTDRRAAARISSRAKLPAPSPASNADCRTNFIAAILKPAAIGAIRPNTSRRCG